MTELSGTVTLSGSAQANVPVLVVDTNNSSDPSNWTIAATATTDSNGDWSVSGLVEGATERYHAIVQYDDGTQYNALSKPYLSTPSAIPDSAIAQWNFEDDSDTTTATDSINGYDGAINGASYTSTSKVGSLALSGDGQDDNVNFGDVSAFQSAPFSLTAWFRVPSATEGGVIMSKQGDQNGWTLEYRGNNDDGLDFSVGDGVSYSRTSIGSNVSADTWVFVGARFESGTAFLYQNVGGTESTDSTSATLQTNSVDALLFESFQFGTRLNGILDNVIFHDTGLSQQEFADEYERQS
jgi:hypothetical protein